MLVNILITKGATVGEMIIKVPVTTMDNVKFTHRSQTDPFHQLLVTDQIYNFLAVFLKDYNYEMQGDFKLELAELVYNSYDAYAKKGLILGEKLKIYVDVSNTEEKTIVHFMDNAGGFRRSKSDERFTFQDIYQDEKKQGEYAGGKHIGLRNFTSLLQENNVNVFFSNRATPSPGAIITMEFPKPAESSRMSSVQF